MKLNTNTTRTIILVIFGSLSTLGIISSYYESGMEILLLMAFCITGLLVWAWSISKDFKEYKQKKDLANFLPSITGLLFIVAILILSSYMEKKRNNPTLLKAYYYDGDFSSFYIDLKKDGNYMIESGTGFTDNYFYGTYVIKDSLITLDKPNITDILKSDKLVIRSIPYIPFARQDTTIFINYIIQLHNDGKTFNNRFRFEVKEDNRQIVSNGN